MIQNQSQAVKVWYYIEGEDDFRTCPEVPLNVLTPEAGHSIVSHAEEKGYIPRNSYQAYLLQTPIRIVTGTHTGSVHSESRPEWLDNLHSLDRKTIIPVRLVSGEFSQVWETVAKSSTNGDNVNPHIVFTLWPRQQLQGSPEPGQFPTSNSDPISLSSQASSSTRDGFTGKPRSKHHLGSLESPRTDLLHHIHNLMIRRRIALVRSPPGTGKTKTAFLFVNHCIALKHITYAAYTWPQDGESWTERMAQVIDIFVDAKELLTKKEDDSIVLVIDDAEKMFWDAGTWQWFTQTLRGHPRLYLMLFANCAADEPVVSFIDAVITFLPRDEHQPEPSLRFTFEEWHKLVTKQYAHAAVQTPRLSIATLAFLHKEANGHIGLLGTLLNLVNEDNAGVDTEEEQQALVTYLLQTLASTPSFRKLVPNKYQLNNPDLARVFRSVIGSWNCLEFPELELDPQIDPVRESEKTGFLYRTGFDDSLQFPTMLHYRYVSWMIHPSAKRRFFSDLLSMTIETIKRMNPANLYMDHREGADGPVKRPSENQYALEFFRCLCAEMELGEICPCLEFTTRKEAKKAGRLDLFLKTEGWGIEILRDGNDIPGHISRFEAGGAYKRWEKIGLMQDYIILDFRSPKQNSSQTPRSRTETCNAVKKFYFVVFEPEFKYVRICDHTTQCIAEYSLNYQNPQ